MDWEIAARKYLSIKGEEDEDLKSEDDDEESGAQATTKNET